MIEEDNGVESKVDYVVPEQAVSEEINIINWARDYSYDILTKAMASHDHYPKSLWSQRTYSIDSVTLSPGAFV